MFCGERLALLERSRQRRPLGELDVGRAADDAADERDHDDESDVNVEWRFRTHIRDWRPGPRSFTAHGDDGVIEANAARMRGR